MKVNPERPNAATTWDTSRLATLHIARAARSVVKLADTAFKGTGISFGQFPVLLMLRDRPTMTQTELAASLSMEQPSMAELLARMERDGLIHRLPDPADRRSSLISLDERTPELMTAVQETFVQFNDAALVGFEEEELVVFMHLLTRLTTNLRVMRGLPDQR